MDASPLDQVLRLLAAAGAGIAVGFNRELREKPLGMRTLALVSLGAAVAALAALSFDDLTASPEALARVVQGILSGVLTGIGFIGAGVVLRDRNAATVMASPPRDGVDYRGRLELPAHSRPGRLC